MRWAVAVTTPPAEEPVTLAEAKKHLRVTDAEQDTWISMAITAAREYAETFQGRAYITQQLRLSLQRWPAGGAIYLPRPPLQSVESVTYILEGGTAQTLDPATYVVEAASEPGAVILKAGLSWPGDTLRPGLPVRVDYTAGYGAAAAVPTRAVQAMLLLIGEWFEHRESVVVGAVTRTLEFAVEALLYQDRFWYSGPGG